MDLWCKIDLVRDSVNYMVKCCSTASSDVDRDVDGHVHQSLSPSVILTQFTAKDNNEGGGEIDNRLFEIRLSVLIEMFLTSISFRGTFKSFWDLTGKSTILVFQNQSIVLNTQSRTK